MTSFNRWLEHYDNLIIVGGVREELGHRLNAALSKARRRNGNYPNLESYRGLVTETLIKLERLDPFHEPGGYTDMVTFFEEAHKVMNWQKTDHKIGGADDQLIAAAITYAIGESKSINLFTNDRGVQYTLRSAHRFLSSRQVIGDNYQSIAAELRKLSIRVQKFSQSAQQFEFVCNPSGFRSPYHYPFWEDMKQVGKNGTGDTSRTFQRKKDTILNQARKFLNEYNKKFERTRDLRERVKTEERNIVITESLDTLLSIIDAPQTLEDAEKSEKGYVALMTIAKEVGEEDLLEQLREGQHKILETKHQLKKVKLEEQIETLKAQIAEASANISDEKSAQQLATFSTELQSLYAELKTYEPDNQNVRA